MQAVKRRVGTIGLLSLLLGLALAGGVAAAQSDSTPLDTFVAGLRTWETEFTQTVTDARGRKQAPEQGRLWVERPGRFRWELGLPDPAQVMVADGVNLWFYDRDLDQVTVRRVGDSMSATPASLLAGTVPLREGFSLESLPRRAGLAWVRVIPQKTDAEFREARLGFAGSLLKRMELSDKLGQSVTLDFTRSLRNQPLAEGVLMFEVPAGADLIGTPVRP